MFLLLLLISPAHAASTSETRAWDAIRRLVSEDATAPILWTVVETKCEDFIKHYPNSEFLPDVLGLEARAYFNEKKYDDLLTKFSAPPPGAVKTADQLTYWTSRAFFEKNNYRAAADGFAKLSRDFPSSPLRLEALYREGEAHAKLDEWPRVIEELREPDGVFQQIAKTNANDQWVVSGMLLLGEAELARKDFDGAKTTLTAIAPQPSRPELELARQYLSCRVQLAGGLAKEALAASTNLLVAAAGRPEWKAKSLVLTGEIHEALGQIPEAIRTYETNLNGDLPDRRRQALLRIVELTLSQDKTAEAEQRLADYLAKYPTEKDADFNWLVLGELRLKEDYLTVGKSPAPGQATNLLQQAEDNFSKIISGYTNSPYVGKAQLDLGWCYLKEGRIREAQDAFSNAVERLPFSEDQAVARFKLGDTYLAQTNATAAIASYNALIEQYASLPAVKSDLFEQVLYQMIRASLAQTNLPIATDAMKKLLDWFPDSLLSERSMLLVGEASNPGEARKVLADFATHWPQSPLLPEVRLAIARTYEKQGNWSDALAQYNDWVGTYSNNPALPRAEFSRAWSLYRSGNESNAFNVLTNFIVQFQTNDLARSLDLPARAQYWIGDYYWRQGDFPHAEISYKEIFEKYTNSSWALRAKMAAGRAASAGQRPQFATNYFTSLSSDPNCPPELRAQAAFALGDAIMDSDPANLQASVIFDAIAKGYTNSSIAADAWGRLGNCYFVLAGKETAYDAAMEKYKDATNALTKAMEFPLADASARIKSEFALGLALAAMARLQSAPERKPFYVDALDHFYAVMNGEHLREKETVDLFYARKAGLEAAKIVEELGEWKQAREIYQKLEKLMPPLQSDMEKRIARTLTQEGEAEKK